MADFGFLSNPASAQVQSPDLLRMAGQAMTLGSMAQQQQLQQLAIQKQQDLINLTSDPQLMAAMFSQGQGTLGQPAQQFDPTRLAGHPAAFDVMQSILKVQEEQAQMQKDLAAAGYSRQQTQDLVMTKIYQHAAAGGTPQVIAAELEAAGLNPASYYDPQNPGNFVTNVANSLSDPIKRAEEARAAQKFPVEQAQAGANLAKTVQDIQQGPALLATKQTEAAAAATQAQTARWHFLNPDTVQDKISGNVFALHRDPTNPQQVTAIPIGTGGAQGATTPAPAPAPTPTGAPPPAGAAPPVVSPQFNTGSAAAVELASKNAANAADMEARIPGAVEGLNTVHNMKTIAMSPQGILAGPVRGSDFFKNVAGVLSQMPGASENMKQQITNTQAWEAQGGELAFNFLSSMKGVTPRAQAALQAINRIKANTMMTPQAQAEVLGHIEEVFQDQISFARKAAAAIKSGGTMSNAGITPRGQTMVNVNPDGSYSVDLTGQ